MDLRQFLDDISTLSEMYIPSLQESRRRLIVLVNELKCLNPKVLDGYSPTTSDRRHDLQSSLEVVIVQIDSAMVDCHASIDGEKSGRALAKIGTALRHVRYEATLLVHPTTISA